MNKLNKKQKLIVISILVVSILSISYYIYGKEGSFAVEDNLENIETSIDEKAEEKTEKNNEEEKIKVHISGAVNNEGLIELENNSRIANAIEKAGGLKENACMDEINLAFVLEDGMKIKIPTKEEVEKQNRETLEKSGANTEQKYIINERVDYQTKNSINSNINNNASNDIATKKKVSNGNSKVNINTANQTELETLPGIGATTALKIISYRNEKGRFKSIEDIKGVSGIGDAKFGKIKNLINV